MPEGIRFRIALLAGLTTLTLAVHYGWVIEPLFGHVHWFHVLHGRFCYIPIVVAASWFGLRGGLYAATVISILILPLVFGDEQGLTDQVAELAEILFYYFLAVLIGVLVDREYLARRKQREAEVQAERSHKLSLVGQIAAGVAHEVKNPLASIKGAADILADISTEPEARTEFKNILQKEVRRIDTTITEFLTFARPKETKLEKTNLSETVALCARQVSAQANEAGIEITTDISGNVYVNGDAEKLHQMTLNLVLNSIQASPEGGRITIKLAIGSHTTAILAISDSGEGIKPEARDRIFEPFFSTKSSGVGLGLAIVKSIVDSHAGVIALTGNDPVGTTATIKIPVWNS